MTLDLIAAARLYDCDDYKRGPCEQSSRPPETWCCPCVARALAAQLALLESPQLWQLERRWEGGEWGTAQYPTHEVYRVGVRHPNPDLARVEWTDDCATAAEAIDAAVRLVERLRGAP